MKKPNVICLCGSTRFIDTMSVIAWDLEKRGNIVLGPHLLPAWYCEGRSSHMAESQDVKEAMDELHLRKIDMADEILVVDVQSYVGESTSKEIVYAESLDKPVRYWSQNDAPVVENE